MIILTEEQASKVAGVSPIDNGAAIIPVPLKDGTFMIGEQVLADSRHADVNAELKDLPKTNLDTSKVYLADEKSLALSFDIKVRGVK